MAQQLPESQPSGLMWVPVDLCDPNPWNPNKMDAFTYGKLVDSMNMYGAVDPLTIRPNGKRWQIIDGEHRWGVARDLGYEEYPAFNTGPIDDTRAMKLTITLNELKGQYDPGDMSELLSTLLEAEDPLQLSRSLPFTDIALQGMVGLADLDLTADLKAAVGKGEALKEERTRWVERVFRLTTDANAVVQSALDKAKAGEEMNDVQALEFVCADFLAGD